MKRYENSELWGMEEEADGDWVKYEDAADLERQLATVSSELDEWKKAYGAQQQVVQDIGENLGANIPYELVNMVARRRMQEIRDLIRERNQYKAACEMADALRPLGAVQVVEGGAAVLLDTSKGAA